MYLYSTHLKVIINTSTTLPPSKTETFLCEMWKIVVHPKTQKIIFARSNIFYF